MGCQDRFKALCTDGETAGSVSDAEVAKAEQELGVTFPMEYQEFLREFGAASITGATIYGLIDPCKNDPPLWENVIDVTKALKSRGQAGTERQGFIPISDDGMGVYFFLNTSRSPDTEIHAIGPGVDKIVAGNFADFFVDLSDGKITV